MERRVVWTLHETNIPARYLVDTSGLNLVANSKASSPGRMARAGSPTTGRSGISFDACSPFPRLTMATDRDPTASPDPTLSPQSASVSHRATSAPPPPSHRDRRRPAVPATRRDVAQWQHHRGPPSYPYRSPPLRGHDTKPYDAGQEWAVLVTEKRAIRPSTLIFPRSSARGDSQALCEAR